MTVNYLIKGTKNPTNLYCRFTNTRATNIWTSTNIFINPENWNVEKQELTGVNSVKNEEEKKKKLIRDEINKKLVLLRYHIFDEFNIAFINGEIIDKNWLSACINGFFNRPKTEVKLANSPHTIYLTAFADWWIENKADLWKVGDKRYMQSKSKQQLVNCVEIFKDFEGKDRIKLKDIDSDIMAKFVSYLDEEKNYGKKTIPRQIGRLKFFCLRAEENNFAINKNYKEKVFFPKSESEVKEPYLSPIEIEKIFNHDFSDDKDLEEARDRLIISVWTGLRISDFLHRLKVDNFIDGNIEIRHKKTNNFVTIPVHPNVRDILIKRGGNLPSGIIYEIKYNIAIRKVCEEVGINELMKGGIIVGEKGNKRKIIKMCKKYELVSSHIGRRSFATNHVGKVPNSVIMAIGGWKSEGIMLSYVKKTNLEYANKLKEYWDSDK